ncbi:MAG TPA: hypothetical protein VIF37_11550 [Methylobacter sp.]|jgi:hypothetical protein
MDLSFSDFGAHFLSWFLVLTLRRSSLYTSLSKSIYILQRLACSERCQLDLPGFKNLEGLHIGMFLSTARGNEVKAHKIDFTLVPNLQIGNPGGEAPASRDGKLELPTLSSQAGAWELALTSSELESGNDALCDKAFRVFRGQKYNIRCVIV